MPAKIRLARHGKKKSPFYHIVIADSRAPRDGRFIERIGRYNPNTNPATIEINFDKALKWLQVGAQPTDTCRAILSYKGVIYKNHLLKGVTKGALTMEQVEAKFTEWVQAKEKMIQNKKDRLVNEKESLIKKRLTAEEKVNEIKAAAVAKKYAKAVEAAKQETQPDVKPETEVPTEQSVSE